MKRKTWVKGARGREGDRDKGQIAVATPGREGMRWQSQSKECQWSWRSCEHKGPQTREPTLVSLMRSLRSEHQPYSTAPSSRTIPNAIQQAQPQPRPDHCYFMLLLQSIYKRVTHLIVVSEFRHVCIQSTFVNEM